jgi:cytochrome c biogenesis protein
MNRTLQRIGSTRLAVPLFLLLGVVVLAAHLRAEVPGWWVAWPLAALAVNLAASIAAFPRLRRGGLGLFHVALLGCVALAAWGRLAHFEGRVELAEGAAFDAALVEATSSGPWHGDGLQALRFEQRGFEIDYAPGVKRGATRSRVVVDGVEQVVGDARPLVVQGYRFTTTHNKGYAPLLRWTPQQGLPALGALHLPSYPLNDWRQAQRWAPPGTGTELRFWLRTAQPLPEDRAWVFAPAQMAATLVVDGDGQRHELKPGEELRLAAGTLRYERLGGWMGYRIQRDPAIAYLFWLAIAGVLGLAWPLRPAAWRRPDPAGAPRGAIGQEAR